MSEWHWWIFLHKKWKGSAERVSNSGCVKRILLKKHLDRRRILCQLRLTLYYTDISTFSFAVFWCICWYCFIFFLYSLPYFKLIDFDTFLALCVMILSHPRVHTYNIHTHRQLYPLDILVFSTERFFSALKYAIPNTIECILCDYVLECVFVFVCWR